MPSDDSSDFTGRLDAADREIQREQLVQKIRALGGIVPDSSGRTSEVELEFFRHVIKWEEGPFISQRAWLERRGFRFAPPGELGGTRLEQELWRLIEALARARVFITCTDHLSDAELYKKLVREVLADEVPDGARSPAEGSHWDFSGADSGDPVVWLTFYASEADREEWAAEFPDASLPPRRRPPYNRDQRLPVGR